MDTIYHHVIVVTGYREESVKLAHLKAQELFLPVTGIVGPLMNGYRTFCIVPDGSKEGWDESNTGDKRRDLWKRWYANSGSYLDWIEVGFGEYDSEIIAESGDDDEEVEP